MGHPVALESLLHFVPIRAFLIGISNNDPFFLPDMAESVEDKEDTKKARGKVEDSSRKRRRNPRVVSGQGARLGES